MNVKLAPTATIVVTSNDDHTPDGCTLREAILAANATAGADTITFSTTIFPDLSVRVITLSEPLPAINDDLTVNGRSVVRVNGANLYQIIIVNNGKTVTLDGIVFEAGLAGNCGGYANSGGTICNDGGTLELRNAVHNNSTAADYGTVSADGYES